MLHESRSHDPIRGQGQGHGGPKAAKMADFKVCLPHRYGCNVIKRLTVYYDHKQQNIPSRA